MVTYMRKSLNELLSDDEKTSYGAVILIALLGFCFRLYLLPEFDVISVDGISYVTTAKSVLEGDFRQLAVYGLYPAVVAVVGISGIEMEQAGRIVSALCGALTLIPLYLLGRDTLPRKASLAACLLFSAWPSLFVWSCEVMTQSLYVLLVTTSMYLVHRMYRTPNLRNGALAGICLASAYLTRPEGFLLLWVMPFALLPFDFRKAKGLMPALACCIVSILVVTAANLIFIRQVTGLWQVSGKASSALTDAVSYYLSDKGREIPHNLRAAGYLDVMRAYPGFLAHNIWTNIRLAAAGILPWPLWIAAIAGTVAGGRTTKAVAARTLIISSLTPLAIIIAFYYVSAEYTQPYLPALFLLCGAGALRLEELTFSFVTKRKPAWHSAVLSRLSLTVILALSLAIFLHLKQLPSSTPDDAVDDGGRSDKKRLGLMLKQLPPGKIMTRWTRIAYYSEREYLGFPRGGIDEVIRVARENRVRYLVVDTALYYLYPELGSLYEPLQAEVRQKLQYIFPDNIISADRRLKPKMVFRAPGHIGMVVYEVLM